MEIDIKVLCSKIADSARLVVVEFFSVSFFSLNHLYDQVHSNSDLPRNQHNINDLIKFLHGRTSILARVLARDFPLHCLW